MQLTKLKMFDFFNQLKTINFKFLKSTLSCGNINLIDGSLKGKPGKQSSKVFQAWLNLINLEKCKINEKWVEFSREVNSFFKIV